MKKKIETLLEKAYLGSIVYRPSFQKNSLLSAKKRASNAYNYLTKKYKKSVNNTIIKNDLLDNKNRIWICWLQGYEGAPAIVKACIKSVYKYHNDEDIILLDELNIESYSTLPTEIIEKWKSRVISNAQFSDLIRVDLLTVYGGTWIDSTVLLTDRIPDSILNSDLFFFRTTYDDNKDEPILMSSWFLRAKAQHPVLLNTRRLMIEYWTTHTVLINYYLFHLFFSLVLREMNEYLKIFPLITNGNSHLLQFNLNNKLDEENYSQIKELTSIHKLTYKNISYEQSTLADIICKEFREEEFI